MNIDTSTLLLFFFLAWLHGGLIGWFSNAGVSKTRELRLIAEVERLRKLKCGREAWWG